MRTRANDEGSRNRYAKRKITIKGVRIRLQLSGINLSAHDACDDEDDEYFAYFHTFKLHNKRFRFYEAQQQIVPFAPSLELIIGIMHRRLFLSAASVMCNKHFPFVFKIYRAVYNRDHQLFHHIEQTRLRCVYWVTSFTPFPRSKLAGGLNEISVLISLRKEWIVVKFFVGEKLFFSFRFKHVEKNIGKSLRLVYNAPCKGWCGKMCIMLTSDLSSTVFTVVWFRRANNRWENTWKNMRRDGGREEKKSFHDCRVAGERRNETLAHDVIKSWKILFSSVRLAISPWIIKIIISFGMYAYVLRSSPSSSKHHHIQLKPFT